MKQDSYRPSAKPPVFGSREPGGAPCAWRRSLLIGATALLVLPAVAVAYVADRGTSIVVRDAGGKTVYRSTLPDSGEFGIEYVHSYYGAPATEHFSAIPRGGFELVEISSPSEAVLDYYELEGRKVADGERTRLVPHEAPRFEELPMVATATGQKTLAMPDRKVPLFAESGAPVHLALRVEEDGLSTELREALAG